METLFETLRDKKARLTEQLEACTDSKAYDLIQVELNHVTKTIHLEAAKEKKRQADELEAIRKQKTADRMVVIDRVTKAVKDRENADKSFFELIYECRQAFNKAYELAQQITQDTHSLQLSAQELGLPEPESVPVKVANWNTYQSKEDSFIQIITQYDLAARHIENAKRNNVPGIPDRPSMDFYHRGMGQFWGETANYLSEDVQAPERRGRKVRNHEQT